MIELTGIPGTREYHAATSLRDALVGTWPDLETSSAGEELVRIASDVKLASGRVTDIDVVVSGFFKPGRHVYPQKTMRDFQGNRLEGSPVAIENFVVAIELKDQPANAVRFVGDKVEVYYSQGASRGWKSASDQNIQQVHAVRNYYADAGVSPFVHRCLFMLGLDNVEVDTAVAAGFTATEFFTAVLFGSPPRSRNGRYYLSSTTRQLEASLPEARFFKPLVPTTLDRVRMDRLLQKGPLVDQLLRLGGEKFTCLRGHGGTGKTVTFLQVAWKAYKERAERTLVLTYNHALAADIRRLLALLGVPSGEEGGITVQTAMSFFYSWLYRLGVTRETGEDFDLYPVKCREALDLIGGGAIDQADIERIKQSNSGHFAFDRVMVDEAQDWPGYEVDLLKRLYRPGTIAIADGIDQLVRGERADWLRGTEPNTRVFKNLVYCLRMKRNLAVFASALAETAGLDLDILPSDKAGGGRIILVRGDWAEHRPLHEELADQAQVARNEPIDSLFCVPSGSVESRGERRSSGLARALVQWGLEAWDGVDEDNRRDFPRSTNQCRVVNYMSCRGLEGWTVVLENLDIFWSERYEFKRRQGLTVDEIEGLFSLEDVAAREAWRWIFIAVTRPIDTLVITLSDLEGTFSQTLLRVARDLPDIVENRIE